MAPSFTDWSQLYIFPDGAIFNKTTKIFVPQFEDRGYMAIEGLYGPVFVHRLVANKYCGGRHNNGRQSQVVDHVDANKHNNQAENLRWMSHSENLWQWRRYQRFFNNSG
jgi:hypothetical protein